MASDLPEVDLRALLAGFSKVGKAVALHGLAGIVYIPLEYFDEGLQTYDETQSYFRKAEIVGNLGHFAKAARLYSKAGLVNLAKFNAKKGQFKLLDFESDLDTMRLYERAGEWDKAEEFARKAGRESMAVKYKRLNDLIT